MKYRITYSETSQTEYVEIYEVEADSEDEAIEKHNNGESDFVENWSEESTLECGIDSVELIEEEEE